MLTTYIVPAVVMTSMLALAAYSVLWLRKRRVRRKNAAIKVASPDDAVTMTIVLRGREAVELWRRFKPDVQTAPAAKKAEAVSVALRPKHRFFIDGITLFDSFQHVTQTPDAVVFGNGSDGFKEVFHYSTGIHLGNDTFVISHIVRVSFSKQHAGGVRVADSSNIQTLQSLDELGLPLVAHFHSHPGFGEDANLPSSTDRRFQERLERGGHVAIGGIFSRDGHVRFFAGDDDRFEIEIVGNKVKKVGRHAYKLELGETRVQVRAAVDA